MDAYEFINSKDVREYLASQNYQLTPVQRAFLVWQSKRHTLEQKHEAWNDIINTLPDCDVQERINCKGWDSLHAMLHGYMGFEQKLLSRFQSDENRALYEYEAWERVGENSYHWNGGFRLFRTYDTCYQRAREYAKEENCRFRIIKRHIDTSPNASNYDPSITVDYDESGHIMDVSLYDNYNFFSLSEEEQAVWNESFTGMWFDIFIHKPPCPDILPAFFIIYCRLTKNVLILEKSSRIHRKSLQNTACNLKRCRSDISVAVFKFLIAG